MSVPCVVCSRRRRAGLGVALLCTVYHVRRCLCCRRDMLTTCLYLLLAFSAPCMCRAATCMCRLVTWMCSLALCFGHFVTMCISQFTAGVHGCYWVCCCCIVVYKLCLPLACSTPAGTAAGDPHSPCDSSTTLLEDSTLCAGGVAVLTACMRSTHSCDVLVGTACKRSTSALMCNAGRWWMMPSCMCVCVCSGCTVRVCWMCYAWYHSVWLSDGSQHGPEHGRLSTSGPSSAEPLMAEACPLPSTRCRKVQVLVGCHLLGVQRLARPRGCRARSPSGFFSVDWFDCW